MQMISAAEAVQISREYGDITTMQRAREIAQAWEPIHSDKVFDFYCMLSAVYTAGYIQGKREERAR